MTELVGTTALGASLAMFIAALRLSTHNDEVHGRGYIIVTPAFCLYLLFHGLASLLPFMLYQFWPRSWTPLITVSPWLVAVIAPLAVNRMLTLEGLGFPEATGPLSRFRDQVRRDLEHRMIDSEFAAMRKFIAPFAKGLSLFEVNAMAMQNIPIQLPPEKADAFREAMRGAKSVDDAMELYIRHIGKKSFRFVFRKQRSEHRPLPLFDEWEKRSRQPRLKSSDHIPVVDAVSPGVVREIA